MRKTALALTLALGCLGCGGAGAEAEEPVAAGEEAGAESGSRSLFERLGGVDSLRGLVDELMLRLAADGRINHLFEQVDIAALKERLAAELCAAAGGPCDGGGESAGDALAGLGITEAHFEAMLEHLGEALEARGAPAGAGRELLDRVAEMKTDIVAR